VTETVELQISAMDCGGETTSADTVVVTLECSGS
jgi:hypothetical protein